MKRSHINALLREAADLFAQSGLALPPWARWSPAEWAAHPDAAAYCKRRQIGWDVTDFGFGDFARQGILLLCTRNGLVGHDDDRSYAEKFLVLRAGQEAPFHFHRFKMEDIIVRGAAPLDVQVCDTDETGAPLELPATVRIDAVTRQVAPRESLILHQGESITLPPGQAHRLTPAPGHAMAVLGEVSRVNDDLTDNVFFVPVFRFPPVEEDEPALYPLWSELPA
jgi:D-lyxose ketol-isomerase